MKRRIALTHNVIASPEGAWQSQTRIAAISIPLFLFAACGEQGTTENITQINQMGMDVVASVEELPECSRENEGEMAFVKGETSARVCVDEKWFATKDSTKASSVKDTVYVEGELSCATEPLMDKSGIKVICNGDSIGVVLNGKDGAQGEPGEQGIQGNPGEAGAAGKDGTNGKDGNPGTAGKDGADGKDGSGCTLSQQGQTLFITCGEKTASLKLGEDGGVVVDTAALDSEKVAVSLDEVSGFTQKGPFLSGSKVLVREMSDGRTLTQTGNSFNGKILNDKGEFKINARMLVSQYVMLEANGYYRNEVTGDNSNSELTLFAITDVTDRNIVNVNLLTHLEYERVVYLVTKKKMRVKAAKKQAQQEVFGLLGIDASGFSNSEDLNIVGSSDEDGALLAFSVMFQGNRTVAQLTELLTQVATDMEEDGTWDNFTAKMGIAEWAADADSSGKLDTIRQNVEGWGLSSMVPKFEPYVRHFWYMEYGLGDCTADRLNEVAAATAGKRNGTKTRYICKEIGNATGDYRWVIASNIEKDTYGWNDSTTADGTLESGDVTNIKYVFDSTGSYNGTKGWRLAVAIENAYGGCVDSLFAKIRSYRGTNEAGFYQCQANTRTWTLVNSNLMIDTQGWTEGDDGFVKWGDSIGVVSGGSRICYVYDTSSTYNGWRTGNNNDCTLGLQGCTKGRAGRMLVAEDDNHYNCANNTWSLVTDRVKINTQGWDCLPENEGEMKKGLVNDAYFVCDANAWREATAGEETTCRTTELCTACTGGQQGKFEKRNEVQYVCDSKNWRQANCAEIAMESLCTANDTALVEECETVGNFNVDYVCSGSKWHAVQHPFEYTLAQWNAKRDAFNAAAVEAKVNSDSMITDPRDNKTYRTVVINNKRVFAENLRYADSVTSVNLKGQTRCYNNEPKNCEIGGRYYYWTAAVNLDSKWLSASASALINDPHQGICPEGWHVPSSNEWRALFSDKNYAMQQAMGYSGWTAATDATGFSALPGGDNGGDFIIVGSSAYFWSATEHVNNTAYYWYLNAGTAGLNDFGYKNNGFAVRCFKDN